jgi:arginase
MTVSLTAFQGRAGDHNNLAIPGALSIAKEISRIFHLDYTTIGSAEPALNIDWRTELDHAMPALRSMSARFDDIYSEGSFSLAATSRCAVSLATLPVIARYHPDACVVWLDSHGDLNTPDASPTGYLGGLALAGPLGLWTSGLGNGLPVANLVLVGQRDLDQFEIDLIKSHCIPHIVAGEDLADQLATAIGKRHVYVHLDCDVLNPGIVPTDYRHEKGLQLDDLNKVAKVIARNEVVGLEIAEFENSWNEGGPAVSPVPLIDALRPLINKLVETR